MNIQKIREITDKLDKLRNKDKELKVFGAEAHKYTLNPVLAEEEVFAFEQTHGITLPADYRLFLLEVGNGGAGPYYGMYELEDYYCGRYKDYHGVNGENYKSNVPAIPDFLRTPFKFSESNPYPEYVEHGNITDEEWERIIEEEDKKWEPDMTGAITLSHQGCAYFDMLIVTGEERGTVWADARASDYGMSRIFDSFTDWYLHWLDNPIIIE